MPTPSVLFVGYAEHPVLRMLFSLVQERGHRRAAFLELDRYPAAPLFQQEFQTGSDDFLLDFEGGPAVTASDVIGVALDSYSVHLGEGYEEFTSEDRDYTRNESWAAMMGWDLVFDLEVSKHMSLKVETPTHAICTDLC